ncbi:MAG: DUF1015 family protein [Pseudomonadales bacterium]|nr:DUF1015 family protein [Pseudomonadales bacterium]
MAILKPFRGIRPPPALAASVAAPPYDVLSSAQARVLAAGNPHSFLHINKPEIDLEPALDPHDPSVYRQGAKNLKHFLAAGILRQDETECYYIYRQLMGTHVQTGLMAVAAVDEYEQGLIKKHEFTRPDKEDDRVNHMDHLDAQVGPVFLTFRTDPDIAALMASSTAAVPDYDFSDSDGVRHVLWVVSGAERIAAIELAFRQVPCLYVADGHHRAAAATRLRRMRQALNPGHTGMEAYNYFLAVAFPHEQMQILAYNRVVKDLYGRTAEAFMQQLNEKFVLAPAPAGQRCEPTEPGSFGMYLAGRWYRLQPRAGVVADSDPVASLDVSILQDHVLSPLLGIGNPRTDTRIGFIGGVQSQQALEQGVNSGEYAVAFACYPSSIENLLAIADAGDVMPPKSTWFEPKLKSGLVLHLL